MIVPGINLVSERMRRWPAPEAVAWIGEPLMAGRYITTLIRPAGRLAPPVFTDPQRALRHEGRVFVGDGYEYTRDRQGVCSKAHLRDRMARRDADPGKA
jgi:hypothetical protein